MIEHMLARVICEQFEKTPGKNQRRQPWTTLPGGGGEKKIAQAMLVDFSLRTNYDVEMGYRHLDLLIYAPMNYVQVWIRERWIVIPLEDLEDADDGGTVVKKGKAYIDGKSEWIKIGDHDSCWPDAVRGILSDKRITGFSGLDSWYSVIPVPVELEQREISLGIKK